MSISPDGTLDFDPIGPPDDGGPPDQDFDYEEAESLAPDPALADPAVLA